MPRGCDHAVHVKLKVERPVVPSLETLTVRQHVERHFIVEFNADGDVLRIKERKKKEPPQIGVYDASWWVAGSHPLGTGDTLPKRVIAAALAKLDAEERSARATP